MKFPEPELPEAPLYRVFRDRGATMVFNAEGDSMAGSPSQISNGDDLYAKPETDLEAANGKVIICSVNGQLFVKRLAIRKAGIFLKSDNPRYTPWPVKESDLFELVGVVIGRCGEVQ
ncbi:MAG TPA: S24 family peptidase [Thermoanaerobaculia bacterium]|nr:S24 family peptidase [Thermoanaerobaculia bacterium]